MFSVQSNKFLKEITIAQNSYGVKNVTFGDTVLFPICHGKMKFSYFTTKYNSDRLQVKHKQESASYNFLTNSKGQWGCAPGPVKISQKKDGCIDFMFLAHSLKLILGSDLSNEAYFCNIILQTNDLNFAQSSKIDLSISHGPPL